ncbi:hypothetical protein ACET3Z_023454 [Daucus carota]
MHHFETPEEDHRISHRVASVDNPLHIQFSQLMDEFQLGPMAEPTDGDFLLAAEEVNVGVDIMIVNGDGVVMGGMPQQMEVFEAPYPEFHVQQHVDGIITDNGGIACINDSIRVENNGEIYVPVQPLRMLTPDNVEIFSVLEIIEGVQPLRIFTPDNREIPVSDVPVQPDYAEFVAAYVPFVVQPLRSLEPEYEGNKQMDNGDEAGPSET